MLIGVTSSVQTDVVSSVWELLSKTKQTQDIKSLTPQQLNNLTAKQLNSSTTQELNNSRNTLSQLTNFLQPFQVFDDNFPPVGLD